MNGTLAVTIQPTILLFLTQFFHEPLQQQHTLLLLLKVQQPIAVLKYNLLLFHLQWTHTLWCSSCCLYHQPYLHQHIPVEQCLNLQNIMHEKWYLSNTWESTVLLSNALYFDYLYTRSQVPLHLQYMVLCTPWHTSSFQLLMNRESWTCNLSFPVSMDTSPYFFWNGWLKVY